MATAIRRSERPLFEELLDWFDVGRPVLATGEAAHPVRIEQYVENETLVVRAEMPGMDADTIEVSIDKGMLSIRAERREETHEGGRSEMHYGMFARRVSLPGSAKESEVSATYADGILTVKVPFEAEPAERKVPVQRA